MTDWIAWFVLAGALVAVEMFTGTFYLLMIAIGFAAGGAAALAGGAMPLQFVAAATIGVLATFGLRRSRWGRIVRSDARRDPNVNLDIGQTLVVDAWSGGEGGVRTARVMYRGALWDVELEQGAPAVPGAHVIREVRGNRLIVANSGSKHR
ncbi:MAG TPA: NfeD family protein [Noviherbaspirillum sp.]|uniref:NfeD family protein n=1 Tax=Noviherbaspirillum sp. TaxID=1926288 RepID=UPI002D2F316D|nr:NfeD family protein [Noviherbaspirillum sp.]HYD95733.1 NfeD family protein [Noviherbaspirillum sp.]